MKNKLNIVLIVVLALSGLRLSAQDRANKDQFEVSQTPSKVKKDVRKGETVQVEEATQKKIEENKQKLYDKYGTDDEAIIAETRKKQGEIKREKLTLASIETHHPKLLEKYSEEELAAMSVSQQQKFHYKYYGSYRIVQGKTCGKISTDEIDIMEYDHLRLEDEEKEIVINKECGVRLQLKSKKEVRETMLVIENAKQ